MNFLKCLFISFILLTSCIGLADISSVKDDVYQSAIQSYQKGEFEASRDLFRQAGARYPYNKFVLYNWGLSEFQTQGHGMAIAAWRRALWVDPGFDLASQALKFALSKFSTRMPVESTQDWERFRAQILNFTSGQNFLGLSSLLLIFSGWIMFKYFGRRRLAFLNEQPLPPFPTLGLCLSLLLLASLTLTTLKAFDHFEPRGTVVLNSVQVRSGPDKESSPLFELFAGVEVVIQRKANSWLQVTYPGGLTGWVPEQSVFHTSGRISW